MILDQNIVLALFGFFSKAPLLAFLAVFCAKWLPYILVLAVVLYALVQQGGILRSLLWIFLPAIVAWISADVIKFLFPAMRPFALLHFTPLLGGEDILTSFPSAHATFFGALAVTLFLRDKGIGQWFLVGALLVGLARVAVGVHFPSDILAGFALGSIVAASGHFLRSLKFFGASSPAQ